MQKSYLSLPQKNRSVRRKHFLLTLLFSFVPYCLTVPLHFVSLWGAAVLVAAFCYALDGDLVVVLMRGSPSLPVEVLAAVSAEHAPPQNIFTVRDLHSLPCPAKKPGRNLVLRPGFSLCVQVCQGLSVNPRRGRGHVHSRSRIRNRRRPNPGRTSACSWGTESRPPPERLRR